MQARLNALTVTAALGALTLGLAACGGGSTSTSKSAGTPGKGGTLKIVDAGDVDHLDTASGYTTTANALERAWTRQLFSYKASNDVVAGSAIVADAATDIPSAANGGISADGKTITVHLRTGVKWNTTPAREVVANDWIRGIKRECNPDKNGAGGNPAYYTATIAGMADFCTGFSKVKDTAADFATYQNTHPVAGMVAKDDHTLVFTLTQPAGDFYNILAMPFASAAPAEYDAYLPDGPDQRQHMLSDGPYAITKYDANKEIDFGRNPAWDASTDPLRKAYVNAITVTEGQTSADATEQQVDAGTADLGYDWAPPSTSIATMKLSKDARLGIYGGANTNPYLRFNFQSPNDNKAMGNVHIRQAIEYAINKVSIAKIYGGLSINKPIHTVIPPGSVGFRDTNLYPTPNDQGDPVKCKALLAQGMQELGLKTLAPLKYEYRNSSNHPKVMQSVKADLAACGIQIVTTATTPSDYYGKFLPDLNAAKQGKWDLAEPGWAADWPGNNGRAIVAPLFGSDQCGANGVNYGCWSDPQTDTLIKQAEAAPASQADALWAQADARIMDQAAMVPFQQQLTPLTRSARVHNALYYVTASLYDPTNVWLGK